ncbi:hypothetical protein [Saccharibacillus alkalitolerans]|uniref:Uncharacterized protein n=1 Tax=Saccharibacillus alkalitolerans TaxID=2705290 RepID=A0ABX0F4H6_9BACL|nr:hypothetical protein [Saccharibacillus alkalitolerans]NGZ74904.1 hypothetical protein [Saccharibacillus alkalitolerans]
MQLPVEMKSEMRRAFEACRKTIEGFPVPFAECGVRYLDRFDPDRGGGPTNYICCLLPYWLRQAAGIPLEQCRPIAEANLFGMLHFHLQDERTDRAAVLDRTHIVLSQLLNAEMIARYAALFRSPEAFRSALLACTAEWASGMAAERESDPFPERQQDLASRSAPLLLCPLSLFEERESLRARALHAVRETLITLQMADDWADYAEDLREGSYNSLVSLYRKERGLPAETPVEAREIGDAVYAGGLLGRYAEFAARRQLELETYREDFGELIAFHAALAGDLERIAAGIETEKRDLAQGGFSYWLLGNRHPS